MRKVLLVDVGARGGIDERWQPYHSNLSVVAFEPDPVECMILNSKPYPFEIKFHCAALGANNDEVATLNLTSARGCSSTLMPNPTLQVDFAFAAKLTVESSLKIRLQRLDSILSASPDVLKVDTQGTELHVLQGAGELLRETTAVELEVEFIEQYLGQPLFADVDTFMRAAGFTLRGLRRSYWRHKEARRQPYGGQLVHGDALYFRRDRLDTDIGHIILAAYRQYDLLAAFNALDLIPHPSLMQRIGRKIAAHLGSGRDLRRLVDGLRPADAIDWHDPDFF